MTAKCLMIQGTGSSVGKSLLVTALCRIFKQDGFKVAPFKSQNMALNSFITPAGQEMGRAQVVQAQACGIVPDASMNPILLKPTSDQGAQVIILGKVFDNLKAGEYYNYRPQFLDIIKEAYKKLAVDYEIVVIEGAGSPAEINLREKDMVNMTMAEIADAPVVLVGDIDKGGVFAWLAGTMSLLTEEERKRVKGVVINKFRGDEKILKPGLVMLEEILKLPVLGVVPYVNTNIDDEDSVTEEFYRREGVGEREIQVVVVNVPYMSNFTDFNVLRYFPDVALRYINRGEALGNPDIVILPGSKNTLADLLYLRESGLEKQLLAYHQKGGSIIGICGGFQMLGQRLADPCFIESELGEIEGLGLLEMSTVIGANKMTNQVEAVVVGEKHPFLQGMKGEVLEGYEIHMGTAIHCSTNHPFIEIRKRQGKEVSVLDGVSDSTGRVWGTYLHGIFDNTAFTRKLLNNIRRKKRLAPLTETPPSYRKLQEAEYDRLAAVVRKSLDMPAIYKILERSTQG